MLANQAIVKHNINITEPGFCITLDLLWGQVTLNMYAILRIVALQEKGIRRRYTPFRGKITPLMPCPAYCETFKYASTLFLWSSEIHRLLLCMLPLSFRIISSTIHAATRCRFLVPIP